MKGKSLPVLAVLVALLVSLPITASAQGTDTAPGQQPPVNSTGPSISGTTVDGQTLTADPGDWSGASVTYSYQWQRCNSSGDGCSSVDGAADSTYGLGSSDVGSTLRVIVTASNKNGSASDVSAASAVVGPAPAPAPSALPTTTTATTTPTTTPTTTTTAIYQVPSSIAGDCSIDVTQQLLSWIASVPDNSILTFGANACYRIEGTLEFSGRSGLDFEGNGATFRSFNPPTFDRAMWRVDDSSGITLRNLTVRGSYTNGGTLTYDLQGAHAIELRGTNATVANVTMLDVAGDCVGFNLGVDNVTKSSGSVSDSSCTSIGRNAVSVTAGNNILVQRMATSGIGYDVFAVEPVAAAGYGASGVTFDSNTIGSYPASQVAFSVVPNEPVSNIAFTNNHFVGQGLRMAVGTSTYRPSGIVATGNSSDTPISQFAFYLDGIDGVTVTGNTVPGTGGGYMAEASNSCKVNVSGNTYPGFTTQVVVTNTPPTC